MQQQKTLALLAKIKTIIREYDSKLTVRQLYYQLVARQYIKNNLNEYKRLDAHLTKFRKRGDLALDVFEDRIRKPIRSSSWNGLGNFFDTVKNAYKKEKWTSQKKYIEVWVEKDALSGIFEPITNYYDVNLLVGRGYQSISSLAEAFKRYPEKETHILYFGDWDATGRDIPRSAEQNLNDYFNYYPNFEIISLTKEDIKKYKLPPAPSKKTDSRSTAFVLEHGDATVELDALSPKVLEQKIHKNIQKHLDLEQFNEDKKIEKKELDQLSKLQYSFKG